MATSILKYVMPTDKLTGNYKITPLYNSTGVYLQEFGQLLTATTNWKLYINFDISEIQRSIVSSEENFETLSKLCLMALEELPNDHCKITTSLLNLTLEEAKDNFGILKNVFTKSNQTRYGRGLINFVGQASRFLFGTMDNVDSDHIEKALNELYSNMRILDHKMANQISVINNVVDVVNRSNINIVQRLNQMGESFSEFVNETQKYFNYDKYQHLFDELATILTLTLEKTILRQNELFSILYDAKNGHVNEHVIFSVDFLNLMKEIQKKLPNNLELPINFNFGNIPLLNNIVKINAMYLKNNLIFEMCIPLISRTLKLYELSSLPARLDKNLYFYVKPETKYVATNEGNNAFVFVTQNELNICNNIAENNYICSSRFPIYNQNKQSCIFNLKNEGSQSLCNYKVFHLQYEMWFFLSNYKNKWYYAMPNETILRINCNNSLTSIKLKDSGMIEIDYGCTASTDQVFIESSNKINNFESEFYFFSKTIVLNNFVIPDHIQFNVTKKRNFFMKPEDLNEISLSLNNIEKGENIKFDHFHNERTIYYSVISILLVSTISVICYLCYKKFVKCKLTLNGAV